MGIARLVPGMAGGNAKCSSRVRVHNSASEGVVEATVPDSFAGEAGVERLEETSPVVEKEAHPAVRPGSA